MLCGWPISSASVKPAASMKSRFTYVMRPWGSVRETIVLPSGSIHSFCVTGRLVRMCRSFARMVRCVC